MTENVAWHIFSKQILNFLMELESVLGDLIEALKVRFSPLTSTMASLIHCNEFIALL